MPITIDESRRPFVTVTFVGTATDPEFDAYLEAMSSQILSRRQQTVTIMEATRAGLTTPQQRKRQADWLAKHRDDLRRYSLGTVFVIASPIVRGFLTAVLWMQPLEGPHTVVGTTAEAERWANERLREAGLAPPR